MNAETGHAGDTRETGAAFNGGGWNFAGISHPGADCGVAPGRSPRSLPAMLRALPLTVALVLAAPALAQNLPALPPGASAMTTTTRKAKLALAKGGALELKPGSEVELLGLDPAAGTARVRFRNAEGTLPLAALGHDGPPPAGAVPVLPANGPLPPAVTAAIPAGATVHELTAADLAQLPPEAQQLIKQAQADALNAKPGETPAPRMLKLESSSGWQQVAPGTPPAKPDLPPGAVVHGEHHSPTVKTERTFKTKEEAERYIAAEQARVEAAAKAKAEELLKREAAKQRPPEGK